MHENKAFFLDIYIFATFHRKPGILISDLYFYNIKIKPLKKYAENHKSLFFFSFFWGGLRLTNAHMRELITHACYGQCEGN